MRKEARRQAIVTVPRRLESATDAGALGPRTQADVRSGRCRRREDRTRKECAPLSPVGRGRNAGAQPAKLHAAVGRMGRGKECAPLTPALSPVGRGSKGGAPTRKVTRSDRPEGAQHTSPGQRPGSRVRIPGPSPVGAQQRWSWPCCRAPSGRPLPVFPYPGRCPGLVCWAPSGQEDQPEDLRAPCGLCVPTRKVTRGRRENGASQRMHAPHPGLSPVGRGSKGGAQPAKLHALTAPKGPNIPARGNAPGHVFVSRDQAL